MIDPRGVLGLFVAVSLAGLGAVFLKVWNAGMAAAWQGDMETMGAAILVWVLVIVAALGIGVARGEL